MGAEGFERVASTAETQRKYREAGAVLAQRWCGLDGMLNPALVCAAFAGKAKSKVYSVATLRLYRQQVLAYVRTLDPDPATVQAVEMLHLHRCASDEAKTAGRKMQSVKAKDAQALLAFLKRADGTDMGRIAGDFFEAGLMFGLRPVEWVNAQLDVCEPGTAGDAITRDGDPEPTHKLQVVNAKANNVRGNGHGRVIYAFLNVEQAEVVLRVIAWARENALVWPGAYKSLANALYYGGHALWPRRSRVPCFYTARHQCIANAKAAGGEPNELAAMFGHASDWTARKHYSRATNGDKNKYMIRASRISLREVRNQTLTVAVREAQVSPVQATKK